MCVFFSPFPAKKCWMYALSNLIAIMLQPYKKPSTQKECFPPQLLLHRWSHKTPSCVCLFPPAPPNNVAQVMLNVRSEQPDCDHDDTSMQEAFGAAATGICFATTTTTSSWRSWDPCLCVCLFVSSTEEKNSVTPPSTSSFAATCKSYLTPPNRRLKKCWMLA